MAHRIVWTTLPSRIEGTLASGKLYASVLVSPRLDGASIGGTPFEDWPATVAGATFKLEFDGGVAIPAVVQNAPDSLLWKALIAPAPIAPFHFTDNSQVPIWSFSVDQLMAGVEGLYQDVATSSPMAKPGLRQGPGADSISATLKGLHDANSDRIRNRANHLTSASEQSIVNGAGYSAFQKAAYLAKRFYSRPSQTKDPAGNTLPHVPPAPPPLDFHQRIALLADHPLVLRKLGLILDLVVPVSTAMAPPATGFVKMASSIGTATPVSPKTAYEIAGDRFAARPSSAAADVMGGLLPLHLPDRFGIFQTEVDGDAHKVVDFASNMMNLLAKLGKEAIAADLPPPGPQPEALPARRTSGFTVTRKNRAAVAKARFIRQKNVHLSFQGNSPADLYADDLVRGYRVDVSVSGGPWSSLLRRVADYKVVGGPIIATGVADEAFVKGTSATKDPVAPASDMYLHEAVFGWDGWSLAVGRPGRVVPNAAPNAPSVEMPNTPPSPSLPLDVSKRVQPGSLVALRFGKRYAFRARVVDLAANSMAHDDPSIAATPIRSPEHMYLRRDPIPPPTLVLRHAVSEAESVEHLVIRSDGSGGTATAYAAWLNAVHFDPAFPAKIYRDTCDRHVAPPKTTQIDAETHGAFDGAFVAGADRTAYYRRATREEGTFADKRIASLVSDGYDVDPNLAKIITPPQVPFDKIRKKNGGPDTSSLTERRGDPLAPGEYVVCEAAQATLPYLPDPAAGGFVLFEQGAAGELLTHTFPQGSWPTVPPVRLRLLQGAQVKLAPDAVQPTVELPPGTILRLRYASSPTAGLLPHMAYWNEHPEPAAARGRHWLMTPDRDITLVHAVQRPITPAKAKLSEPTRSAGDTFVTLSGSILSHSRSTGHVDVVASWFEYLDLPTRPMPNDVPDDPLRPAELQNGTAFQLPVAYGVDSRAFDRLSHEFGDTKHRKVTYATLGTTRYREYMPPAIASDPALLTRPGNAEGPSGSPILIVKSSARPAPPKIESIVPTFRWDISPDGKTRKRLGNGLRIYMGRGWYSSGEGEKLAAIVGKLGATDAVLGRCSRWGNDPLWTRAPDQVGALTTAAFKNATVHASLLVDNLPGTPIDAAVFAVEFSAARGLWFCDIEMAAPPNQHTPFVSLSLARYQKESLPGLELSSPVRADFAQLLPDRTATVTLNGSHAAIQLSGVIAGNFEDQAGSTLMPAVPPALILDAGPAPPRSRRVRAYLQQRVAGSVGELGFETKVGPVYLAGKTQGANKGLWKGNLGTPALAPGLQRRIVIEEVEMFRNDETPGLVPDDGIGERIVYVDTIDL